MRLPFRGDLLTSFFRERAQAFVFLTSNQRIYTGLCCQVQSVSEVRVQTRQVQWSGPASGRALQQGLEEAGRVWRQLPPGRGPGLQAHSLRVPCCIHGQAAAPSGIAKTAEAQGEGSLCRTLS